VLSAAQRAVDSIASSQLALSAATNLRRDVDRIAQNRPWNQVGDLTPATSYPELAWSRVGMNSVDATSILPAAGRLFVPNMPRDCRQNMDPPSLPFVTTSGQATLPGSDPLRLQDMLYLQALHGHQQSQQQELHGLTARVNTVNSTHWRNAQLQVAGLPLSASTSQDPTLVTHRSRGNAFTAHKPTDLQTLQAPSIDQEGASNQIASVRLPCTLSNPFDARVLSNHQCYLCQQIEIFAASIADVAAHVRGRNKRIVLDQVGIRCHHCAHVPMRNRQIGSTYFPATMMGFYQAAQNMLSTHIQCGKCEALPESVAQEFLRLLVHKKATSTGGRKYWAERILELGLVDTDQGVFAAGNVPPQARILPMDCVNATSGAIGAKSKRSGALHLKAPPPKCV
jgi:hypothetical protein